jgi:hypothetical protein
VVLYLSIQDYEKLILIYPRTAASILNRYMDLAPALDRLGSSLGLVILICNDVQATPAERGDGKAPSRWLIISSRKDVVAEFLSDPPLATPQ